MLTKRQVILKPKGKDRGKDVYVRERSTVKLSKEVASLKFEVKNLKRKLSQKEAVIRKQIEVLDSYREEIKELKNKQDEA